MHAYVFIYTLVPGMWALALDIHAVAHVGTSVVPIVKPKKTVHKLKRCSTQATFAYHRQIHNFAILALFDFFYLPIVSSMSSQGFEGAFDFFYLPIVINFETWF